ncbi:hypothetical protein FKX85_16225 [Echinicola soli]|uniref:VLRF1 domain-containing protein n=1 Tax=Echinicola soli TaxID=2591634 RepID=A0A514CLC8_9BACT|nr:hypothetical protein [Echinicola soli]QDH80504.1 hypothetical protein FKX85_16225 [Echinicola soli]
MNEKLISATDCQVLVEKLTSLVDEVVFDNGKNTLYFYKDTQKCVQMRLPIFWNSPEKMSLNQLEETNYILLIIRSGIAAVGYFENGENIDHKVFRAYMVRKKQGKSQIKHLKTKGKSRAGSRVRLAETLAFFEAINSRLRHYFEEFRVDKIGVSYATTLVPYVFGSKVAPPFTKEDPRIFKIPKHIANPTFESLLETNLFMLKATVKYEDHMAAVIVSNQDTTTDDDLEDW